MNRPRFLADEDFRRPIVLALRRFDPTLEISTVQDQGLSSASDEDILEFAAVSSWLLLTHDVNSMLAVAERRINTRLPLPGIFLIPQFRSTSEIVETLAIIGHCSEMSEWKDRIVFLPL